MFWRGMKFYYPSLFFVRVFAPWIGSSGDRDIVLVKALLRCPVHLCWDLQFWGGWCDFCVRTIPLIIKKILYKQMKISYYKPKTKLKEDFYFKTLFLDKFSFTLRIFIIWLKYSKLVVSHKRKYFKAKLWQNKKLREYYEIFYNN